MNKSYESINRILELGHGEGWYTIESPEHFEILDRCAREADTVLNCYIRLSSGNQFGVDVIMYGKEEGELDLSVFPVGEKNPFSKYFVGDSYLYKLGNDQLPLFNVTFEPGCRNNWHIHKSNKAGGQILICVYGNGWYQEEGKEARLLHPGDIVNIPPNVKHWHGATKNSYFQHLAIEVPGEDCSTEWWEKVTDEEYERLGK